MKYLAAALTSMFLLVACSPAPETAAPAPAAVAAPPAPTVSISAPAGEYKLDPYHSSLSFQVMHVGLAPYVARFTRTEATLTLDPANLAASKISANIDPTSVRTDFSGDFKGTHKGTPYASFDEKIAKDAGFFKAGEFPQIGFQSTTVAISGPNQLKVAGDLTFLGQTHPVTLAVTVTGSVAQHPWTKLGAVGFTATGTFNRTQWGMDDGMVKAGALGDAVTVRFSGEFHQQGAAPAR